MASSTEGRGVEGEAGITSPRLTRYFNMSVKIVYPFFLDFVLVFAAFLAAIFSMKGFGFPPFLPFIFASSHIEASPLVSVSV